MTEDKSTPRPWALERGQRHHKGRWVITAAGMGPDTPLANLADFDDASEADAALIVQAVNSHDAMKECVEALKTIAANTYGSEPTMTDEELAAHYWGIIARFQRTAKAALSKLEKAT